jgi:hypothetical protein
VVIIAGCGGSVSSNTPDATVSPDGLGGQLIPDAAVGDAALPDTSIPDASVPDAASPDASPPDAAPACSPPPTTCASGFCWFDPVPTADLHAVRGTSATDVWAVGASGAIVHFDGTEWTVSPSCVDDDLFAVDPRSLDDVVAAGEHGTILRWDGIAWERELSHTAETITGLWGKWAVGTNGTILREDPSGWQPVPSPTPGSFVSIWGSAPDDVYAAAGDVIHWDGSSWSLVAGAQGLYVWGTSKDLVWILGAGGLSEWDGAAWSTPTGSFFIPAGVWGDAADDVYVASQRDFTFSIEKPFVQLFTGAAVKTVMSDNAQAHIDAIWGSGPDDVWTVGDFGTIEHSSNQHFDSDTFSVFDRAPDDVWAAGTLSYGHFDGTSWTFGDSPSFLYQIWAAAPDQVWAASRDGVLRWTGADWVDDGAPAGEYRAIFGDWAAGAGGLIAHHDSTGWTQVNIGETQDFAAIGEAGGHGWIGGGARLCHHDGVSWSLATTDIASSEAIVGIWTDDPDDVWVTANDVTTGMTRVHRLHGGVWSSTTLPDGNPGGSLTYAGGVWGAGPDDVYVAGVEGYVHWDGASWTFEPLPDRPDSEPIYVGSVSGASPTDVWIAGAGALLHGAKP